MYDEKLRLTGHTLCIKTTPSIFPFTLLSYLRSAQMFFTWYIGHRHDNPMV